MHQADDTAVPTTVRIPDHDTWRTWDLPVIDMPLPLLAREKAGLGPWLSIAVGLPMFLFGLLGAAAPDGRYGAQETVNFAAISAAGFLLAFTAARRLFPGSAGRPSLKVGPDGFHDPRYTPDPVAWSDIAGATVIDTSSAKGPPRLVAEFHLKVPARLSPSGLRSSTREVRTMRLSLHGYDVDQYRLAPLLAHLVREHGGQASGVAAAPFTADGRIIR